MASVDIHRFVCVYVESLDRADFLMLSMYMDGLFGWRLEWIEYICLSVKIVRCSNQLTLVKAKYRTNCDLSCHHRFLLSLIILLGWGDI